MSMTIWVDADACPKVIRDILCRAAQRVECPLVFVANHLIPVPASPWITARQVESGFDVADDYIAQQAREGDLVITSDIPLAAEAIEQGAGAISSRGEQFTASFDVAAAYNPRSTLIPINRIEGITRAVIAPSPANRARTSPSFRPTRT